MRHYIVEGIRISDIKSYTLRLEEIPTFQKKIYLAYSIKFIKQNLIKLALTDTIPEYIHNMYMLEIKDESK